jgi:drug/metabolite transporter (DMT)-like permease
MPFITLGASSLLTGERLSAGLLLGALLVIGGVYLGAFQRKAKLAAGEDANLR